MRQRGHRVLPKQGNPPVRSDYPAGTEGAKAYIKDRNFWVTGGQTPNTITIYVLLRYSAANDSKISKSELEKIGQEPRTTP